MLGRVINFDIDGNIGRASTTYLSQNVCGLLIDTSAQTSFWESGAGAALVNVLKDTTVELTSLEEAKALGIVADGDNVLLQGIPYYHIKQFFEASNGHDAKLYLCFADCKSDWNALIEMQRVANGEIGQFGIWTEQNLWKTEGGGDYTAQLVKDIESVAETMANDYFSPASIFLSANTAQVKTSDGSQKTVDLSKIPELVTLGSRYVTVLLSQQKSTDNAKAQSALASATPVGCVGLALGCVVAARVNESIGHVANFNVSAWAAQVEMGFGDSTVSSNALTNATPYEALSIGEFDTLDDKGYVFLMKYLGRDGVYFSSDNTCSNGDYCYVNRNRVINKARRGVRGALLPYVNSPIMLDPATGRLSTSQIATFKDLVTTVLNAMMADAEISGFTDVNLPADQDVLRNDTIELSFGIVPTGTGKVFKVTEYLTTSQNS